MKIAMMLNSDKFSILDKDIIHAFILDIEDGFVVSIDDEFLTKKNVNYISLWIISKQIKELYLQSVDDATRSYFERLGVAVKTYEDIKNNPMFIPYLI